MHRSHPTRGVSGAHGSCPTQPAPAARQSAVDVRGQTGPVEAAPRDTGVGLMPLRFAVVDEALSAAPEVVATQSDLLFLAAEFNAIRRDLNAWRELATHEAPATSAYVQAVDRHLGRLLEALMLRELGGDTENVWRKVDLYPDGLSFRHEQSLMRGSVLDLRFLLPGTGIGIRTLGRVVHCDEPQRDGCHWIGVRFLDLGDADRELLCQYLGAAPA
ncbi:MAG: PilZ domain-containing protein [Pseudomonadota bacterium]